MKSYSELNQKVLQILGLLWDLYPEEFEFILRDAEYIHLSEASEYAADSHDTSW